MSASALGRLSAVGRVEWQRSEGSGAEDGGVEEERGTQGREGCGAVWSGSVRKGKGQRKER